jgi:hypothetical protein
VIAGLLKKHDNCSKTHSVGNVPNLKRDKDDAKYSAFCNSYINGWDDARFALLQGTRTFCPPSVSIKEMSVVFFDYVASHAEARKLSAAETLMLAFKNNWSSVCASKGRSSAVRASRTCKSALRVVIAFVCPITGWSFQLGISVRTQGYENLTFKCVRCNQSTRLGYFSDPMKSPTANWANSSLQPPE